MHLEYAHETFLVFEIIVLLFYLLGRLIDWKVVALSCIDWFLCKFANQFGLLLKKLISRDSLVRKVPFATLMAFLNILR